METLKLGDSYELIKSLPDNSIDLIITDPPYIVPHTSNSTTNSSSSKGAFANKEHWKRLDFQKDTIAEGFDIDFFHNEFSRIQKSLNVYYFCNTILLQKLMAFYDTIGFNKCEVLVWHKLNPMPIYKYHYLLDMEYVLFVCENKSKMQNTLKTSSKLYQNFMGQHKCTNHPTEKPVEFIERFVVNSSVENDVILDPFMGVGSTGIACKKHNRNFIGFEIMPQWFEIANSRLQNFKNTKNLEEW